MRYNCHILYKKSHSVAINFPCLFRFKCYIIPLSGGTVPKQNQNKKLW